MTTKRLAGKTALITGGSSGIGLVTAQLFTAEGARVAITGRDGDKLDRARREIGPNALAAVADVSDFAALEAAVSSLAEQLGGIDIVFANAGIAGETPLGATDPRCSRCDPHKPHRHLLHCASRPSAPARWRLSNSERLRARGTRDARLFCLCC